jgi:predicted metal-binding protein
MVTVVSIRLRQQLQPSSTAAVFFNSCILIQQLPPSSTAAAFFNSCRLRQPLPPCQHQLKKIIKK